MAECKNLEVKFVDDGVRETICTSCVHREVCVYKQTYLEYLSACEKMHSEYRDDISFIGKKDPDCKFCMKKSDFAIRDLHP